MREVVGVVGDELERTPRQAVPSAHLRHREQLHVDDVDVVLDQPRIGACDKAVAGTADDTALA